MVKSLSGRNRARSAGIKRRGAEKVLTARARRHLQQQSEAEPLSVVDLRQPKPAWIRVRLPVSSRVGKVRDILRSHRLTTVCEEASCPNLAECFGSGTATFMILGEICTRRCAFCDVATGIPLPPDPDEPENLARAIAELGLSYVVITSVDRDDLQDGGAGHFAACIAAVRKRMPDIYIEVLVPDFRNCIELALPHILAVPPDVFNHNIETVPELYRRVRPGADYHNSLMLLKSWHLARPVLPAKSGLMLGLGETREQVLSTLADLLEHGVSMLTLGQYLQPSPHHLPVARFVAPEEFKWFEEKALNMGFSQVAAGPLVRSSYHAEQQITAMRTEP